MTIKQIIARFDSAKTIYWIIFALLLIGFLVVFSRKPTRKVIAVARDVPAYHIFRSIDLTFKRVREDELQDGAITSADLVIKHYARKSLHAGEVMLANQVGPEADERLISNTLKVEIPLENILSASGNLVAGDVVSIAAAPSPDAAPVPVISEVLVLDVESTPPNARLTLAIPLNAWPDFLAKTNHAKLVIARHIR